MSRRRAGFGWRRPSLVLATAVVGLFVSLVVPGCGSDDLTRAEIAQSANPAAAGSSTPGAAEVAGHPDGWPGVTEIPDDVYDPFLAGEETPDGFRQLIGRDWIAPVYVPTFVSAGTVEWPGEELVIGVDLEGEARAYPVGFLTRREIVVDLHRGIPTLVTW